jgi:hypothetical protein
MKRKIPISLFSHLGLGTALAAAQMRLPPPNADPLTESGQITTNGHKVSYVIHRLPPSSFPDLPAPIADVVNQRGCLIPQTYEAHRPENVVEASLERTGSQDWALLCSVKGSVSLLVFFASALERPVVLATAPETERLQMHDPSRVLGFNWGIDPASPEQVHEAQIGIARRPAAPDHDALADSMVDRKTIYRFYSKGKWTLVDLPE